MPRNNSSSDRNALLEAGIVELLPALRAFSNRLQPYRVDAEDLMQETVMKALANLEGFQDGSNLKAWLFTIMKNTFCSKYQIARREAPGRLECAADLRSVQPSQEWEVFSHEFRRAWRKLPKAHRQVLQEIAIDGRSYAEVAIEFGCAEGTIKSRLNRARHELLDRFGSLNA